MRRALILWLLILAGVAPAEGTDTVDKTACYVLWEAQCFEIHNARTRDITHHILLTNGPVRLSTTAGSCTAPEADFLDPEEHQALLEAFNRRMADIDGCDPLEQLDRRAAPEAASLVERFQRLKRPHDNREVHRLEAPSSGS